MTVMGIGDKAEGSLTKTKKITPILNPSVIAKAKFLLIN